MQYPKKYTLTVLGKVKETSDSCTVKFKQPGLKKITYQAGQYLTLILKINGRLYHRAYSLSSVYGIDETIDITVKSVPHGIVSNYIVNQLNAGDTLEVLSPMGDFILPEKLAWNHHALGRRKWNFSYFFDTKKAVHQAGGPVIFNYSSKNEHQIILLDAIKNLLVKNGNRITCNIFLTEDFSVKPIESNVYKRLNAEQMDQVLANITPDQPSLHYICGPAGYVDFVRQMILKKGFSEDSIKTELFKQKQDAAEMKEVVDSNLDISAPQGNYIVAVKRGESFLNALLDELIDIPHACQTGSCLLCKVKVEEGEVLMISNNNSVKLAAPQECLLCCSYPLNKTIKVSLST